MIVSVKCLENTYCMGETYKVGKTYRVDSDTAAILGPSVEVIETENETVSKEVEKEISAPPRNKMMGKAPKTK